MIPDKVIYTDGRDVTVTDSTLKVKNTAYQINGITKLSFFTVRPDRWPGVLLLFAGLCAAAAGFFGLIPNELNIQTNNGVFTGNALFLFGGLALSVIGLIAIGLTRERYAVRIATAEGEKNAIVSNKREYIQQIVDALNRAFKFGQKDFIVDERKTAIIR